MADADEKHKIYDIETPCNRLIHAGQAQAKPHLGDIHIQRPKEHDQEDSEGHIESLAGLVDGPEQGFIPVNRGLRFCLHVAVLLAR